MHSLKECEHPTTVRMFTGSLLETWVPLLHGGCIIIAPSDEEAMGQLLSEARVTAILMEGPEIYGLLEASAWS